MKTSLRVGRRFALISIAASAAMIAPAAQATVHRVFPNQSIQAALDAAAPGDTILVEPGVYKFTPGPVINDDPANPNDSKRFYYGLRIKTDNLRLIGKEVPGRGNAGKVRLVYDGPADRAGDVGAGIYAAPDVRMPGYGSRSCDPDVADNEPLGQYCRQNAIRGFYVRGFTVEGFPRNGIQTRWVNGFQFVRNTSANNLNNGIYPTLSANGLVQNNVSYGSLDTAMWVAGSENVRVIGNEVFGSVIGFEITVSNNVHFIQNKVYDNTVGVGLFHPNGAGNPPTAVSAMENWVIEHNDIRNNNRPNEAPPGTFQSALPPGIGVIVAGVSGHSVSKNVVANNAFVGIGVLGWCTANARDPKNNCDNNPPVINGVFYDPAANDNLIALNKLTGNGTFPAELTPFPPVDLLYAQIEPASGNCFQKNKPDGYSFFSAETVPQLFPPYLSGLLPTDGCKRPAK